MTQVLEYILANYTWFLVGAVLVLLAIIGYYADKTNFGQGNKTSQNQDNLGKDDDNSIDISNIRLSEVTKSENKNKFLDDTVDVSNNNSNQNILISSIEPNSNLNAENSNNDIVNNAGVEFNKVENIGPNVQELSVPQELKNNVNNENILQLNEEKFNMFSAEFDSLLPKKNIINTDLLSDIEDLEFDKTQKIDLSGVPDLDDIELPKIVGLSSDDEDIWKF